ncbi:MAG: bifunctional transaldolase/phosoglucose isomerase [Terriglobales bacterium]|jgi:transaldolase/glucose-6-phosphate isomerase
MKAMVLAAGLGTRLRPLTESRPKALVEVNGRTLLEIALSRLRSFGIREVIVNAHHFADMIVAYLEANENFGMRVQVSREEVLLDTGGGLKKAAWFFRENSDSSDEPFLLHNVDVISTIDLRRMVQYHKQSHALATLAVQDRKTSRYLLFDEQSQLCGRRSGTDERPELVRPATQPNALAFSGIHVISPRLFAKMSEDGVFSIVTCYLRLAAAGEKIVGFRADEYYWRDLGTAAHIAQAAQDLSVKINRQTFKMPADLNNAVCATLDDWKKQEKARRLWRGDSSLWTATDEANWLGWMGISDDQLAQIQHLKGIAEEVKAAGFKHALLLGMGGSSLCPEVMRLTFGKIAGYPELHVLDSTDPAQIRTIESRIDYKSTVFIVSSKSGSTLEPNIFKQYFFERAKQELGAAEAGNRFIAITDPGSNMQRVAESDCFRHIFYGLKSIGGRYSALSDFGMVPAAVMGVDMPRFLNATEEMVHACGATVPAEENPGVVLGAILGTLGVRGRDKVTIITSPGIFDLGAWLEQLIAESTGKIGKGLVPVDRERLGKPEVYGNDRVFAYLRLDSGADKAQDAAIEALEKAGQPVVRIAVAEDYSLGGEFFRWEIATAVAGSVIGINPFDQPDVEAAKIATRKLTSEYEQQGSLPPETPLFEADGIRLYTDPKNADALKKSARQQSLAGYLKAHLDRANAGDYFAVLAFIEMNDAHQAVLQGIRHDVRDSRRVATCLGFGPRFLHSTGQAYKGGPNSGVFLQITCDDAKDLPVPGQKYTFGVVKAAQARGDFQVLADRGRRALRVHLGPNVGAGLATLAAAVKQALQ